MLAFDRLKRFTAGILSSEKCKIILISKKTLLKLIFDVNYRITEYIKYLTKNIDVKMKIC